MSPVTAAVSGAPQQPEIPSSVSTVMTASVSTSTRRAAVTKGAGSGCDRTAAVIAIMRKASSRSLLSVRNAAKPKKTAHRRVCFQTERPADGLFFRTYFSYGHFIIYYIPAEIKWSYKKAPHALGATVLSQDLGEGGRQNGRHVSPEPPRRYGRKAYPGQTSPPRTGAGSYRRAVSSTLSVVRQDGPTGKIPVSRRRRAAERDLRFPLRSL